MNALKNKQISLKGIEKIAILADCGCVKDWEDYFPKLLKDVWETHSPQVFIVIGDIVLRGRFKYFKKIAIYLDGIPATWIGLPGNHDRPLLFFRKYFGSLHKIIDIDKWRLIGLNTANKKFTRREADWLEKNLSENTIILSHIPPAIEGWSFYSLPAEDSDRFLNILSENSQKIKAAFFGHIHGLSKKIFNNIPMIVTGGAAHSMVIEDNRYNENTFLGMVIFDVKTGEIEFHEMK
jgi:predicted phosphodiesterase